MKKTEVSAKLLDLARLTNAQWLAVSLFEDVIELPERVARGPAGSVLGRGSPARYHLATAAPTIGSAIGAFALATGMRRRDTLGLALAGTAIAAGLTGFLIRSVNIPLLRGSVAPVTRASLAKRWHRVNGLRLIVLLAVGALLERASLDERAELRVLRWTPLPALRRFVGGFS